MAVSTILRSHRVIKLVVSYIVILLMNACSPLPFLNGATTTPGSTDTPSPEQTSTPQPTPTQTLNPTATPLPQPVWNYHLTGFNKINSMTRGWDGFIWTATQAGIVVWNLEDQTYETYTILDGMPGVSASDIFTDHEGVIWVKWWNGDVSRYANHSWMHFTPENYLASGHFIKMLLGQDNSIWIIYSESVSRYKEGVWTVYGSKDGLIIEQTNKILAGLDGSLWIANNAIISRFHMGTWTHWTEYESTSYLTHINMFMTSDGRIWLRTKYGIITFEEENWKIVIEAGASAVVLRDVVVDQKGNYWLATEGLNEIFKVTGVFRYDGTTLQLFTEKNGLPANTISYLAVMPDGSVWAGTQEELSVLRGSTWYIVPGMKYSFAEMLVSTATDGIWIFTSKDGLFKITDYSFPNVNFTHYCLSGRGMEPGVYTISEIDPESCLNEPSYTFGYYFDPDNQVFVRYPSGGFFFPIEDTVYTYLIPDEPPAFARKISMDSAGFLWVMMNNSLDSDNQLYSFKDNTWFNHSEYEQYLESVLTLETGPDGRVWAGTKRGVSVWDGHSWLHWLPKNESGNLYTDYDVYAFTFWDNDVYVGHKRGISRLNGGRIDNPDWEDIPVQEKLALKSVEFLEFDQNGNLWAGSPGEDIGFFDGVDWTSVARHPCFSSDKGYLSLIKAAPDGSVWFNYGNYGFCRFNGEWEIFDENFLWPEDVYITPENVVWVLTSNTIARFDGETWTHYQTESVNESIIVDSTDQLWLGTQGGLVHVTFR